MNQCHCPVSDWRGLREALDMTQAELADLLQVSRWTVIRLEAEGPGEHHCLRGASVLLLRTWLQDAELRERLADAGFAHPWPEDGANDGGTDA